MLTEFIYFPKIENQKIYDILSKYCDLTIDNGGDDHKYLKLTYSDRNSKFFGICDGLWVMFSLDTVDIVRPILLIRLNERFHRWTFVLKWLNAICDNDNSHNGYMFTLFKPKEELGSLF